MSGKTRASRWDTKHNVIRNGTPREAKGSGLFWHWANARRTRVRRYTWNPRTRHHCTPQTPVTKHLLRWRRAFMYACQFTVPIPSKPREHRAKARAQTGVLLTYCRFMLCHITWAYYTPFLVPGPVPYYTQDTRGTRSIYLTHAAHRQAQCTQATHPLPDARPCHPDSVVREGVHPRITEPPCLALEGAGLLTPPPVAIAA